MSDLGSYETVTIDADDGITTVTLDRPEKKNAMNPQLHRDMHEAMHRLKGDALDPDGGTNVLVLTGAGDSFCAGQDLKEFFLEQGDNAAVMAQVSSLAREWGRSLYRFPRATIARVNGWCFGAGMRLLTSCDLAIASEEATFGLSEVNFGVFPAGGSTWAPAHVMGKRDFLHASLTGQEFDAAHAERIRLVNETVAHGDLDDAVADLALTINDLNPTTVQFAKEVYQREIEDEQMSYETAVDYEISKNRHLRQITDAEDLRAIRAFADKKFQPGLGTYSDEDIGEYSE